MKRRWIPELIVALAVAALLAGCGGSSGSGSGGSPGTIGVSVAAAATTLDGTNATTLSATVTNDKNAAGVSWSVTGGGALSGTTASSATYTAPAAASAAQTITVTATSVADATKFGTAVITIPAQLAVTTASSSLTGAVGSSFSASLAASGGISPYTWSVASGSSLPAGLSLSSSGALSGVPMAAAAGSTSVQFTVKDSGTATALTTTQSLTFGITAATVISFTGTVPSTATINTAYTGSAAATGGAGTLTYSIASGALPTGLTLNASTGALTGTPTAAGTFGFTVKAADAYGDQATKTCQIAVSYAALNITTGTPLPPATIGVNYSTTLAASGGSGTSSNYSWALASGSSLPAGLGLSTGGTISGKPAGSAGTSTFTVTVTDAVANLQANATFSLTVSTGVGITTTTLTGGNVGSAYSATLAATGGTGSGYAWTASSSNLSTYGLSLSSAGVIGGTPTQAGTASFTAQVTDSGSNTATQALTITIYAALSLPSSPSSLPSTVTVGSPYAGTITASGGSGNYSWTVTGLSDGFTSSPSGATLTIAGTPTSAATVNFGVTLKDTSTNNTASLGYGITANTPAALTLPTPNPSSLPAATQGQAYTGSITATGGASPYTWTVNSIAVPANGSQVPLSNGLYVTSTGSSVLNVAGTPAASGPVAIAATVKDNVAATASQSYTVTVNASGYKVSGSYYLENGCGSSTVPQITMTINTATPQSVTTDSSGNFSFSNILNGTYTITPSATAPSAVFKPSAMSVTVNNGAVTAGTIAAQLGYNISGSVSYSGAQALGNPVYVWAQGGCSSGQVGTLIPAATMSSSGAFTIHGVPIGTYTLFARMDPQGNGFPMDKAFPLGETTNVTVSGSNVTGQAVTLSDPASYAITTSPTLNVVTGIDQGVIVDYNIGSDIGTDAYGNTVIDSPYYQIEWSSTNSFSSPTSTNSLVFPATNGIGAGVVFVGNEINGVSGSPFVNGAQFYFRMRGYVSSGSSNNGPWAYFGGSSASSATPVTIGAATGSNTISGTVTFTGTATGPLYVGYFSSSTGVFYGERIANPVSPQAYSVQVPSGSGYMLVATVDNNNDGMIDAGDFANTRGANGPPTASVTGPASGQNIVIPGSNVMIAVTTQNNKWTSPTVTTGIYGVYFDIRYSNKIPVSAQLIGGPNAMNPVDIGRCISCGAVQFQYGTTLGSNTPTTGDTYTFQLTYTDGTTEQVTGSVTGVNTAYPTSLMPQQTLGVGTTPTFSWNYPSSPASYTYQFRLWNSNGTSIWQVPGSSSNSSGFTSAQVPSTSGGTGITWGTDPLGGSNTPSVASLTSGTTYYWSLEAIDANGNSATRTIYFIP